MKRIAPLTIAAGALALSFVLASPAEAHKKRHDRHRHHDRHHVEQRYDRRHHVDRHRHRDPYRDHRRFERRQHRRHHRFDVPRRIHYRHHNDYRRYFDGDVWFAPHRHRHATYSFPVVIDGYRTYRRHAYCEGELFRPYGGSIGYEGRRWGVRFDF